MSKLFVPKVKPVSATHIQTLVKQYHNLVIGKNEIIKRVEYVLNDHGINLFVKKTPASKASDIDYTSQYDTKCTVYSKGTGFSATDNHLIKEFKQYIVFLMYIIVNYTKGYEPIKRFVDMRYNNNKFMITYCADRFQSLKGKINNDNFTFFNDLDENCIKHLKNSMHKIFENLDEDFEIPLEVHTKCVYAVFSDVLTHYTYDKAVTYAFSSQAQLLNYITVPDEECLGAVCNLYTMVLAVCAAPKKGTTSSTGGRKSTAGGRKKAQKEEVVDDDDLIIDDEDAIDESEV